MLARSSLAAGATVVAAARGERTGPLAGLCAHLVIDYAEPGWDEITFLEEQGLEIPTTVDDLTKPEYKDLFVAPSPATSSPGLAFLTTVVGLKGDGWLDTMQALVARDDPERPGVVRGEVPRGHRLRAPVAQRPGNPQEEVAEVRLRARGRCWATARGRGVGHAGMVAPVRELGSL